VTFAAAVRRPVRIGRRTRPARLAQCRR
jgi:hypothetical protein